MSIELDAQTLEVKLPAFLTITRLAKLGRITRYTMRQVLQQKDVHCVRAGKRLLIPMAEIEKKIPALYKTLHLLEAARRARRPASGLR